MNVVVMFTYQYRSAVPSNQPSKSSNNSLAYCDKNRGSMAGQCTHRYLCIDAIIILKIYLAYTFLCKRLNKQAILNNLVELEV